MKTKFVGDGKDECSKCCYPFRSKECLANPCHESERDDGRTGHYELFKASKRPGKYERLLKAMLRDCDIEPPHFSSKTLLHCGRRFHLLTDKEQAELIKIKESMK